MKGLKRIKLENWSMVVHTGQQARIRFSSRKSWTYLAVTQNFLSVDEKTKNEQFKTVLKTKKVFRMFIDLGEKLN